MICFPEKTLPSTFTIQLSKTNRKRLCTEIHITLEFLPNIALSHKESYGSRLEHMKFNPDCITSYIQAGIFGEYQKTHKHRS